MRFAVRRPPHLESGVEPAPATPVPSHGSIPPALRATASLVDHVLHLLAQRPSETGSGVTLDALVARASPRWQQTVVVGVPAASAPGLSVGGLPPSRVRPLRFGPGGELPFALPGMSDVMPYPSSRYSALSASELDAYRRAWRSHLARVLEEERPTLLHAHHVWLASAILRELAPSTPLVIHCHATGLRQLELCPVLADEVRRGCARAERLLALSSANAEALCAALGVRREKVVVVGAGYRAELFHARGAATAEARRGRLLYVGKLAAAKGLPQLLDAFERLAPRHPELVLELAGGGAGAESEALRARIAALGPRAVLHGPLAQPALAERMRRSVLCVLPSFYEGVPLVLVEALACGCRLVATALPGIVSELAPHLGEALELCRPPRLEGADRPLPDDLPGFVDELTDAIERSLARPPLEPPAGVLERFTWESVFTRIESVWRGLLGDAAREERKP